MNHHSEPEEANGCARFREALSADLDGEELPIARGELDAHLRSCPSCRAWRAGIADVTRLLRVRTAERAPDLVGRVRAAADSRWRSRVPRLVLGAVAICQLLLGVVQLPWPVELPALGHGDGHLFNESTAWNLALGCGLLVSAARPQLATGLVPALAAFLVVLTGFSAVDAVGGAVTPARLISHAPLVLGFAALLWTVAEQRRGPRAPIGRRPERSGARGAGQGRSRATRAARDRGAATDRAA